MVHRGEGILPALCHDCLPVASMLIRAPTTSAIAPTYVVVTYVVNILKTTAAEVLLQKEEQGGG